MTRTHVVGWHFLKEPNVLAYSGERVAKVGESETATGPIVLCENGLHLSERLLDAYAHHEGPWLRPVIGWGELVTEVPADKWAARHRYVLADPVDARLPMSLAVQHEMTRTINLLRGNGVYLDADRLGIYPMLDAARRLLEPDESVTQAAATALQVYRDLIKHALLTHERTQHRNERNALAVYCGADEVYGSSQHAARSAFYTALRELPYEVSERYHYYHYTFQQLMLAQRQFDATMAEALPDRVEQQVRGYCFPHLEPLLGTLKAVFASTGTSDIIFAPH